MWIPRPPEVFGEAHAAKLLEQRLGRCGHPGRVRVVGAGLRVEIEAQLVRVIDVRAAHRPWVEGDRAHLRRPADHGDFGRADLVSVTPGGECDRCLLHVLGGALGNALLVEGVALAALPGRQDHARVDPFWPAFERGGSPQERAHDAVADRQVVAHDVELGDGSGALGGREDHAIGIGHAQIAPAGVDDHLRHRSHERKFYRPGPAVIVMSPNDEWASIERGEVGSTRTEASETWPRLVWVFTA